MNQKIRISKSRRGVVVRILKFGKDIWTSRTLDRIQPAPIFVNMITAKNVMNYSDLYYVSMLIYLLW